MRIWLFSLLILSATLPAAAAETLVMKRHPDSTSKMERNQKTEQTLTIGEGNIETSSSSFALMAYTTGPRAEDGSVTVTQKHEVLQTELNIVGMTLQFDSANPDAKAASGNLEPFADMLRITYRTPVTMVFDKDNQIREVTIPAEASANIDPNFADLLKPETIKKGLAQMENFLPKKPVNVGDKWEATTEAPLGGGQTLSFDMQYELLATEQVDGRPICKIKAQPSAVRYAMDPNSPSPLKITESTLTIETSEGEILFDVERGAIVKEESKLRIKGPLKFSINGNEIAGKLDLTMSSKTVLQK